LFDELTSKFVKDCYKFGDRASSIDWAQLNRFYLKTETIQSPKRCVLKYNQDGVLDKNRTMDNVQKHNICTNLTSSQTFRSYLRPI
jgi:hypothetical protein